jgi:hypothetical protein
VELERGKIIMLGIEGRIGTWFGVWRGRPSSLGFFGGADPSPTLDVTFLPHRGVLAKK